MFHQGIFYSLKAKAIEEEVLILRIFLFAIALVAVIIVFKALFHQYLSKALLLEVRKNKVLPIPLKNKS